MAEAMDSISCSICLDTQKDPVTIPCGHNYCMGCIKGYWDQDDLKGVYSCPLCKEIFIPRPVLKKNTLLAELVDKLKTGLQTASPAHYYAGSGDVECNFCTGRKLKAVKSCLGCLASYCETHLQPHYEYPAFKKHKLIKASTQLEEKICSRHDKLLEVYCRTDQQFICYHCLLEHKGHDTVSVAAERTEKQSQLQEKRQKSQQRIQKREKEMQELRQSMESLQLSVQAAVEDSDRIFTELIRSIEQSCSEVKELIRGQEKIEVIRADRLLEQLKQEVAELRRIDAELEQLSNTEDHMHFLQSFQSLSVPPGSETIITVNQCVSIEGVKKSLSGLIKRLEHVFNEEMPKVPGLDKLTLDPNTAHRHLCLSEGNRKVTWSSRFQSYPDHADRFTSDPQVLCSEGLSGACYWEVEWRGSGVYIAVSYKGISREECLFGQNDQSWCLICSHSGCSFYHNDKKTAICVPSCSRVGVYLDHRAGTLSFYSVSDTMTLLCRVQTTFTQPLYPGLGFQHGIHFGFGPSVKILSFTQKITLI